MKHGLLLWGKKVAYIERVRFGLLWKWMQLAPTKRRRLFGYLLLRHNIPEDLNIRELSVKTIWSYHTEARGKVYLSANVFSKPVAADPIF